MVVIRSVLFSMFQLRHVLSIFALNYYCKCTFERNKISSLICSPACAHTISVSSTSHSDHARSLLVIDKKGGCDPIIKLDTLGNLTRDHGTCDLLYKFKGDWMVNKYKNFNWQIKTSYIYIYF